MQGSTIPDPKQSSMFIAQLCIQGFIQVDSEQDLIPVYDKVQFASHIKTLEIMAAHSLLTDHLSGEKVILEPRISRKYPRMGITEGNVFSADRENSQLCANEVGQVWLRAHLTTNL